ncbi:MAG: 3-hydroxyacyl-CoA dehydrogenase NAD-binding domain-containing protein [Phycisphaerae bacterium]
MERKNQDKTVGVVGAGTMGRGIAQVFAQAGFKVRLYDAVPAALEAAAGMIGKLLDRAVDKGRMEKAEADATRERIVPTSVLSDIGKPQLIIEAATELLDIKIEILKSIDSLVEEGGIIATNTSSISITKLGAVVSNPQRFVGMHFFNPVPVMQLVEVVRGLETSDATIQETCAVAEAVGKTPLIVNDHPGFVSNRVLMPMINEAAFTLQDGVADAETIDGIMKMGMNHPMGPLALADLIGIDVCLFILEVLHRDLGEDRYRPCPLLRKMVDAGRLGRKTKRGFYSYD